MDRMMNEDHRRPAAHSSVVKEAPEPKELSGAEAPRSDEGGLRNRGGKADDSERSAQPHKRKAAAEDAGVRQIARHVGRKFLEESLQERRTERVRVVVSGNDADAVCRKSELLLEQRSHRDELATKRKICQISCDYNMIWRKVTDFVKEAHQDLRPMHRLSLETKIRVPTCPL
jgi:hypothetical protein